MYLESPEFDFDYLNKIERDLLGINLSYHLLADYTDMIEKNGYATPSEIEDLKVGYYKVAGILSRMKTLKTKAGTEMAFIEMEDPYASFEGVVFPEVWIRIQTKMQKGRALLFEGTLAIRDNKKQLVIQNVHNLVR
jgi:DNA polymerase-3 subunit alpha